MILWKRNVMRCCLTPGPTTEMVMRVAPGPWDPSTWPESQRKDVPVSQGHPRVRRVRVYKGRKAILESLQPTCPWKGPGPQLLGFLWARDPRHCGFEASHPAAAPWLPDTESVSTTSVAIPLSQLWGGASHRNTPRARKSSK